MKICTILFCIFTIAYISLTSYMGFEVIQDTLTYKQYKSNYSNMLNYKKRLLDTNEYLKGASAWQEKLKNATHDLRQGNLAKNNAIEKSWYIFFATVLYLATVLLFNYRQPRSSNKLILSLIVVSISTLVIGLFAPMLEISAFEKDLIVSTDFTIPLLGSHTISKTFQGEMYFYYQSKSVFELVQLLIETNNTIVAICITLFSVIIPIAKLFSSLLVLLFPRFLQTKVIRVIIFKMSKWSMADVFIIATFLAYISFNNLNTGVSTESNILTGLYFFLSYCLLSLTISELLDRHLLKKNPT